jgi:hypothetical protein
MPLLDRLLPDTDTMAAHRLVSTPKVPVTTDSYREFELARCD